VVRRRAGVNERFQRHLSDVFTTIESLVESRRLTNLEADLDTVQGSS